MVVAIVVGPSAMANTTDVPTAIDFATTVAATHANPGVIVAPKVRTFQVLTMPPPSSIGASPPSMSLAREASPVAETNDPEVYYDLRLARSATPDKLATIKNNLRQRGTGMRDAYLHGDHGLRMSVGNSYHMQYRGSDLGVGATGSGPTMRRPLGAVNLRDGYEGYAPVAMAGYDTFVTDRMKIGVEGGMMIGRSTAMYADETVPGTGDGSRVARNPVADLVMTYAF